MSRYTKSRRNALKMQFLPSAVSYVKSLEEQIKILRGDPQNVVAQFIKQIEETASVNNKLSALVCAAIKEYGTDKKITIKKETIEGFAKHRLTISVEQEGETFVFSYAAAIPGADAVPEGVIELGEPVLAEPAPEITIV